jgi:signal peptidase I
MPQTALVRALIAASAVAGGAGAILFGIAPVESNSMIPTMPPGSHVLVRRFHFGGGRLWLAGPSFGRGDIVIVKKYGRNSERIVKRIVGIGGDRIAIREGILFINGDAVDEPYAYYRSAAERIADRWPVDAQIADRIVPPSAVFLLGDNRSESSDSRAWGPATVSAIVGRAILSLP